MKHELQCSRPQAAGGAPSLAIIEDRHQGVPGIPNTATSGYIAVKCQRPSSEALVAEPELVDLAEAVVHPAFPEQ